MQSLKQKLLMDYENKTQETLGNMRAVQEAAAKVKRGRAVFQSCRALCFVGFPVFALFVLLLPLAVLLGECAVASLLHHRRAGLHFASCHRRSPLVHACMHIPLSLVCVALSSTLALAEAQVSDMHLTPLPRRGPSLRCA